MGVYVALLRAVNVGGTGQLEMPKLRGICEQIGFSRVQTYIASGNVVFSAKGPERVVKTGLEEALKQATGNAIGVLVRTENELAAVLAANPFAKSASARTVAIFLDRPPGDDALASAPGIHGEELALGVREIYVHYVNGIGRSKLKIPAARAGTARNMNTVARLVALAGA